MSATFDEVCKLVSKTYDAVWTDWYSTVPGATKAKLDIMLSAYSACFSPSRNQMVIPIADGNLEDFDILDENGWPIWKIDLIHEMLHEWQSKTLPQPTPEAYSLHEKHPITSCDRGHGPDFFEAIVEKAEYFSMTSAELADRVC